MGSETERTTASTDGDEDSPSLLQRLHDLTGDRDAEAAVLRDRTGPDVTERDATIAVQRAHGETGPDEDEPPLDDIARPADAEAVADERD